MKEQLIDWFKEIFGNRGSKQVALMREMIESFKDFNNEIEENMRMEREEHRKEREIWQGERLSLKNDITSLTQKVDNINHKLTIAIGDNKMLSLFKCEDLTCPHRVPPINTHALESIQNDTLT